MLANPKEERVDVNTSCVEAFPWSGKGGPVLQHASGRKPQFYEEDCSEAYI